MECRTVADGAADWANGLRPAGLGLAHFEKMLRLESFFQNPGPGRATLLRSRRIQRHWLARQEPRPTNLGVLREPQEEEQNPAINEILR